MRTYEFTVNGLLERRAKEPGKAGWVEYAEGIQSIGGERIGFHYGQQTILDGVSLEVRRGDFFGIQGDSGRGKTTLFNILLGFVEEGTGQVKINGVPVGRADRKRFWSRIAYVKQQPFILHDSILVNITLQEQGYDEERLKDVVALSGLDEVIRKLPGGLQATVTENGKNISGGQRQRIAIARALYKQADLILLDEPFSELDDLAEERLLRRFAQLAEAGKLVIMITHNKQSLAWCTNTLSLDTPAYAE
jgi:ABC-type bacteriocin/lantibiotic exporter with double-glycine peptidase domain